MIYTDARELLVDWLRKQLIGPASAQELLHGSPLDRYPTGILFPIMRDLEGIDPASVSEDDDEAESPGEDTNTGNDAEPATKRRRYMPPSSVGFSFFVQGEKVEFQVGFSAACYKGIGERDERGQYRSNEYQRSSLGGDEDAKTFAQPDQQPLAQSNQREDVLGGRASIDVLWRPFSDGWIVTVSLFNKQELNAEGTSKSLTQERIAKSLFEVNLRCVLEAGEIGNYPRVDKSLLNEEDQELELQYKHRHIYAIGHGAAVDWRVEQGGVKEIWAEFMPAIEVPQVTADVAGDDNRVLDLAHLANSENTAEIFDELGKFVEKYSAWISAQNAQIDELEPDERATAERITARMETALERMRRGVVLLVAEPKAAESFRLANQAMLDQMRQADCVSGKTNNKGYHWRPFQLAFLLAVIESAIREDDDYRDIVDLIWFPTGGGKTEAYLGLIAFLIVWRRLTNSTSGGGTTVLMRYTLRLLTAQQYLRATRMICALELIRRRTPRLKDGAPITVGMWVGSATSPNRFQDAQDCVQKAINGNAGVLRSLVLECCPWCGTPFKAPESYIATETEFHFCCTNIKCDFGQHDQGILPCNVVDEALYDDPPTLLIATIDKFARLAWDERANAFFGVKGNRPPELVIQDELHLIAGALGSVAGLYEAALDTVLIKRGAHPKYIASTATIRMAEQQVERLYGRKLAVFPPPGLSCDDSYFARTVPLNEKPGRMYVGYLAPMLNRQKCMAPLAAALLAAPEVIFDAGQRDRDALLEAWWTQVIYHGSLKGVGNSHNAFNIDVPDVLRRLKAELKDAGKGEPIQRPPARIAQLTSISSAEENARTFSRLEKTRDHPDCLDAVLATNMVSVGLDVPRLALMIVNDQPLTTAEYIQASSRVGRSEVPGLVFANYYRDQARSLSHYESFRPYHEAFYRFVEPTSVTPYTYQARTRALHAALVIAIRHAGHYLLANNQAGQFNPDHDYYVKTVIKALKLRCAQADPERAGETDAHIDLLVKQWRAEAIHCQASRSQLNYQAPDNNKVANRLLHNHDDQIKGLWSTLQSMRNVENTALLKPL